MYCRLDLDCILNPGTQHSSESNAIFFRSEAPQQETVSVCLGQLNLQIALNIFNIFKHLFKSIYTNYRWIKSPYPMTRAFFNYAAHFTLSF